MGVSSGIGWPSGMRAGVSTAGAVWVTAEWVYAQRNKELARRRDTGFSWYELSRDGKHGYDARISSVRPYSGSEHGTEPTGWADEEVVDPDVLEEE